MLSEEEVMHVAKLARIDISEEEKESFKKDLKVLLDEVSKIKDVEVECDDLLITPVEHNTTLREDKSEEMLKLNDIKKNVPKVKGNFVEVPVMINE